MRVSLNWSEQLFAAQAGILRRISAINNERSQARGMSKKLGQWEKDIEGAGAELAVANLFKCYWYCVDKYPGRLEGDVGTLQVRSTQHAEGCLIVHDYDRDDARFLLVRGTFPDYDVVGWTWGCDAKCPEFWSKGDGRPAYFVPASRLHPINDATAFAREVREQPLLPIADERAQPPAKF